MNKTLIASIVVITVIVVMCCCCATLISGAAAAWIITSPDAETELIEANEPAIPPQATATILPTAVPTIFPDEVNPPENDSEDPAYMTEMAIIESQVSELRGLSLDSEIERKTFSQEQLNQYVMEDILADTSAEDNRLYALILNQLGLLKEDFDLNTLFVDLYSEQIAGFYDEKTKAMVVVAEESFSGAERLTYAHEFTHALQDDAFGLGRGLGLNGDRCLRDSEYCAAVQALVEGDATLTESLWFLEHVSTQDKQAIIDFYNEYESPVFDTTPHFLQADFYFAYENGLAFVQSLYDQGGMAAVDAAYADPPVSTEQIMHPQRYPNDKPDYVRIVGAQRVLGEGWTQIDDNTLGEWYTYLLLSHSYQPDWNLSNEDAMAASEGWGGDRYVIFEQKEGEGTVLAYRSEWDTIEDANEFWQYFGRYGQSRWGEPEQERADYLSWNSTEGIVVMAKNEDTVLWLMTPDEAVMEKITSLFPRIFRE